MFKKLYNKFFKKEHKHDYGYVKFTLYSDSNDGRISCELNVDDLSEESVHRFSEFILLLHIGALTELSIGALSLIKNKDFIHQVLALFKNESKRMKDPLAPVVSPSNVFRYKNDPQ